MKKHLIFFLVMIISIGVVTAQDEENQEPKKKKDRPVVEMFGSALLIDEQTSVIPAKKTLEMQIQHRFGLIKNNGASDLWGIYAPSANTRMGLSYSILDNLEVGYGITRKNMYNDFHVKWNIIEQTRKNTIPVTVTLYGNMAIDGRNESVFATSTADSVYKFTNRLSYFSQVIVSRKFNDWLSLGVNASFTHYNSVPADTAGVRGMNHDKIGLGIIGQIKFSPQSSIIFHYSIPLDIDGMAENTVVTNISKSNFGIGYQVATDTHAFEMFISASNGIIPQDTYMWNTSDWTKGEFRIGFNITRLWGF